MWAWGKRPGVRGAEWQEGQHRAAGPWGPLPAAPAPSAASLACIKNCISFTFGTVRPSVDQFNKYLPWFLSDPPNIKCPKG